MCHIQLILFIIVSVNHYFPGNPADQRLRKVEKEVLIPMKMREKAKVEKCFEEVRAFSECCKSSSIAMVVKCRVENSTMKACLTRWYQDEEFRKMCEVEYLRERTDYRRTGVKNKPMKKYEG
jgi:COX assembly protein 1